MVPCLYLTNLRFSFPYISFASKLTESRTAYRLGISIISTPYEYFNTILERQYFFAKFLRVGSKLVRRPTVRVLWNCAGIFEVPLVKAQMGHAVLYIFASKVTCNCSGVLSFGLQWIKWNTIFFYFIFKDMQVHPSNCSHFDVSFWSRRYSSSNLLVLAIPSLGAASSRGTAVW